VLAIAIVSRLLRPPGHASVDPSMAFDEGRASSEPVPA
jgi:hypothetical protein